jgi:hypothetical protein
MDPVTPALLRRFLTRLGEICLHPAALYLVGGSALRMLGSLRETLDVDYMIEAPPVAAEELRQAMTHLAAEMQLDLEEVPMGDFIPLPPGAYDRRRLVGRFGLLEVYLFDPYSIALSKIARGFESDLEDVLLMLGTGTIEWAELEQDFRIILPRAGGADIDPEEFRAYFAEIERRYKADSI